MTSDADYRLALAAMLLAVMPILVYHRLKARTDERISRREEGLALAIVLRLCGLLLWVAFFLYLVYPRAIEFAQVPLVPSVRWLGALVAVAGVAMVCWTMPNLGKNLTDTVVTRRNATLVTSGPYRWVRHPFYICAALLMLAATLLSANALIGLASTAVLSLLALRTPLEEQKLIAAFGEDYRAYMRCTGRFWPRWRASDGPRH